MSLSSERAEHLLFLHVDKAIDEREDPFVTKAILRLVGVYSTGTYEDIIPRKLLISQERFAEELAFLEHQGLVKREDPVDPDVTPLIYRTIDGAQYVGHPDCSDFTFPDMRWDGLDPDEVHTIFDTISPFTSSPVYGGTVSVPLSDLEPIETATKAGLKTLQRAEQESLLALLGLPKGSSVDISFSSGQQPTWKEGAGYVDPCRVSFSPAYGNLTEALNAGVDSIESHVRLVPGITVDDKVLDSFPVSVQALRFGGHYRVGLSLMTGPGSPVWERPVEYQRAGIQRANQMGASIKHLLLEHRTDV